MHAMRSYLNSFSCFVENNSKTTARVVAVCEICMSTAAIKRGRGDVDVDRLRFHAAMIDVCTGTIWFHGLFGRGQLSRSYLVPETV